MLNIDRLSEMNPWWKTGDVRKELVPSFKRGMFPEIQKYMEMRQIIAIVGKGLIKFMDRFDVETGFVITEDYEAEKIDNGKIIRFVPLWKWIL